MAESEDPGVSSSVLCEICNNKPGIYQCPRCNVFYCSVNCYQSRIHVNCSESFYRDCVTEEMRMREGEKSTAKMYEAIMKTNEMPFNDPGLDSDDNESIPDLEDRMKDIDLDDPDAVWEKLTPEERRNFEDILQSGDVSDLVPTWEPWWLYRKQKPLIQDMDAKEKEYNYKEKCPPLKEDVPTFSQLCKSAPSPSIKLNVVNVLAAYCYTARYFNGEHHDNPLEASSILMTLSGNLNLNHNYDSYAIAIEAVAHEVVNCDILGSTTESIRTMKDDAKCILDGPDDEHCEFYLQSFLSDVHKLLSEAKISQGARGKTSGEFTKRFGANSVIEVMSKIKLKTCLRKLEYYLSWSYKHFKDIHTQLHQW